jgi:hypothetical protein
MYYEKYLKYKNKYIELKNQFGGAEGGAEIAPVPAPAPAPESPSIDMIRRAIVIIRTVPYVGTSNTLRKLIYDIIQAQKTDDVACPIYEELNCPIHLGLVGENGGHVVTLVCGHTFCRDCIGPLINGPHHMRKCPECRANINVPLANFGDSVAVQNITSRLLPIGGMGGAVAGGAGVAGGAAGGAGVAGGAGAAAAAGVAGGAVIVPPVVPQFIRVGLIPGEEYETNTGRNVGRFVRSRYEGVGAELVVHWDFVKDGVPISIEDDNAPGAPLIAFRHPLPPLPAVVGPTPAQVLEPAIELLRQALVIIRATPNLSESRAFKIQLYDLIKSQRSETNDCAIYKELRCLIPGGVSHLCGANGDAITLLCGHTYCRECIRPYFGQICPCIGPNLRCPCNYRLNIPINTIGKSVSVSNIVSSLI